MFICPRGVQKAVSSAELCNYFPIVCLRATVQNRHILANEVVTHITVCFFLSFTLLYLHLLSIMTTKQSWDSPPPPHLGLLHLHDVGLAVSDAVIDIVDVGAQGLQLLVQGGQGAVGVRALHCHLFSLSGHPLPPLGQLLPLLKWF